MLLCNIGIAIYSYNYTMTDLPELTNMELLHSTHTVN